jgi:hypothetical protein
VADRYWKQLSSYDAKHCEEAKTARCTCRCGGLLHGLSHTKFRLEMRKILDEQGSFSRDDAIALAGEIASKKKR